MGNGRPRRFVPLVKNVKGGFIVLHFIVTALALNFPVMFAIARLEPWDLYSRLYGSRFAEMLPEGLSAPPDEALVADFNRALYAEGFGRRVMLPMLAFAFILVLILHLVFYLCAAFFLGLSRMTGSPLARRDRFGLLIFSSTLPAVASALFGLWLPTVHLVVFYLAEIILACALSRAYEEEV
ncbi:MAG: hypothetical protein LBC31_00950 [Treponema sp.]|nr:hypothetical protein [Treponema sp.]